jgi:hypothetical protein
MGTDHQDFRDRATDATKKHKIPFDEFHILNLNKYEQILEDILNFFTKNGKNNLNSWRWWNDLKDEFNETHLSYRDETGWKHLDKFIDSSENLWFVALETINQKPKYWACEGKIKAIQQIVTDAYTGDYFIISKKFRWMIGENPYAMLEACGEFGMQIVNDLKKFEDSLNTEKSGTQISVIDE